MFFCKLLNFRFFDTIAIFTCEVFMPNPVINKETICSFFRIENNEVNQEEISNIQGLFEYVVFKHDETIIQIDDQPDYMYYLESGVAAVYDREEKQVNLMHQGVFFGEYGALTGEKRLTTVKAEGKVSVFTIERNKLMEIMAKYPSLFSETMKRLYDQISNKHGKLIELSKTSRGKIQSKDNGKPLSKKQMLLQYGSIALIFILSLLVPSGETKSPVFLLPLCMMIAFALITRRTVESLIISSIYAALLSTKMHMIAGYTDALMNTMVDKGNVFTVLVMALMGGFVTLIEASGSLTGFKKLVSAKIKTKKGSLFASILVLMITAVDDCLNMLCASTSMRGSFDKCKVSREESSMLMSFLPITLCSFVPVSLWGIYIVANINTGDKGNDFAVFCKSIPFNFYSIIAVVAMILLCLGKLPKSKLLKAGVERVEKGGNLYPEGSYDYLYNDEDDLCGKTLNLLLPIFTLAISSLAVKSISNSCFIVDSACGLIFTLLVMMIHYCGQKLMSPEEFMDNLVTGIQSMVLPIAIYLITMCFSMLLGSLNMNYHFDEAAMLLSGIPWIIPGVLFFLCMMLTTLLGSSWAMYVLGFPLALSLVSITGINLELCLGAVCAAGIAGEKNCLITGDATVVATALGINPSTVLKLRFKYSTIFSAIALGFYLIAGLL